MHELLKTVENTLKSYPAKNKEEVKEIATNLVNKYANYLKSLDKSIRENMNKKVDNKLIQHIGQIIQTGKIEVELHITNNKIDGISLLCLNCSHD